MHKDIKNGIFIIIKINITQISESIGLTKLHPYKKLYVAIENDVFK